MNEGLLSVLVALCVCVPVLLLVFEFASFMSVGWFINDKVLNEALDQHVPNGCDLNPYNLDIVNIGKMPFISTVKLGIFGLYYVNNVGRVRYGTLGHKRIRNIHTQLLRKYKEEHSPEKTLRQKLNIK
jgi:hypothetical protein